MYADTPEDVARHIRRTIAALLVERAHYPTESLLAASVDRQIARLEAALAALV